MRESIIQKSCLRYCSINDILCFKVDSTSTRGLCDLLVILPNGKVLFVELKTETGVLSAMQKYIINKIRKNNATAEVIRNEKEFIQLINKFI